MQAEGGGCYGAPPMLGRLGYEAAGFGQLAAIIRPASSNVSSSPRRPMICSAIGPASVEAIGMLAAG